MPEQSYLQWLAEETPTDWWHDSADLAELKTGLEHKAVGVWWSTDFCAPSVRTQLVAVLNIIAFSIDDRNKTSENAMPAWNPYRNVRHPTHDIVSKLLNS